MSMPALERGNGSPQPEIRQFGTVSLGELARVAGVAITDGVITLGSEGWGISTRITSKGDRWEIEEYTHIDHLGTHDFRFYAPNVVILNGREGRVDFIDPEVVRDRQRGVLVYTIMTGSRVGPSFRANGEWEKDPAWGKAIAFARGLRDGETPQEPVLTYPEGEAGFTEDPVPH